jgi:hypothetical protein
MRLLTIGNSFAANATQFLDDLAEAAEKPYVLGKANLGGCSLERHWRHASAYEADPADPEGRPYLVEGEPRSLAEILRDGPWDVVTLQQFSWISHDPDTYRPYAQHLHDYVRTHAPEAEVRLHQTWAYRADELRPGFAEQSAQHAAIRNAYHAIADELGVEIIPVGDAFDRARNHPDWHRDFASLEFDPQDARPPELPDETHSLCHGYFWARDDETGEWALSLDTHHANAAGCYLGAAVFYESLYGESVVGNPFRPESVEAQDAAFLQRIAHETCAGEKST